jgi:protoporphyrinogen oxidase
VAKKKIAIVGGGITGLYLGYRLIPHYQVTIFEKNRRAGGLLETFHPLYSSWSIDNFYHHFFSSDQKLIHLLKELNLPYLFKKPVTATWQNNQISPFSSPKDLFAFPHLDLFSKLRLGAAIGLLKAIPDYHLIPDQEAIKIFPTLMGKKTYQTIWQPLMRGKFSSLHQEISAVWLWARIKKRSTRLGYPEGGFANLTKILIEKFTNLGGKIKTNQPITKISQLAGFDQIVFTTPKKILGSITLENNHLQRDISYLASLNLILLGSKPILKNNLYWLSIADTAFPFVAVINQAGLVNKKNYNHRCPTYIGGYYQQNDPILTASPKKVLSQFIPSIKKINPQFRAKDYQIHLSKYLWAQPIVTPGYPKKIPSFKTKYQNIYLVNMEQIYPWDRGINYALELVDKFLKSVAWNNRLV